MASDSESRLTALPEQLLEEILLRLPAPEDLARATAACVAFSRYLTDGAFLRRYRRRHAPPLLGFLDHVGFNPALPPHPSAPTARSLASPAADFGFSFLPSRRIWSAMDARDGRFLLAPTPDLRSLIVVIDLLNHHHPIPPENQPPILTELVVCDPLHRSYVMIPPLPNSMSHGVLSEWSPPFFLPQTQEEEAAAEESSTEFSVIWMVQKEQSLSGLVFSSRTGRWREAVSRKWVDLGLDMADTPELIEEGPVLTRHYAYGAFYWHFFTAHAPRMVLIVLDTRSMDLSVRDVVLERIAMHEMQDIAIVEAGEGRLGLFAVHHDYCEAGMSELRYFVRRDADETRPGAWHIEKTIPLGSGRHQSIKAATERLLILERGVGWPHEVPADTGYFSVDVGTLKLERFCGLNLINSGGRALVYTNFPATFLSSLTL